VFLLLQLPHVDLNKVSLKTEQPQRESSELQPASGCRFTLFRL